MALYALSEVEGPENTPTRIARPSGWLIKLSSRRRFSLRASRSLPPLDQSQDPDSGSPPSETVKI